MQDGFSPLYVACQLGHNTAVGTLLKFGADYCAFTKVRKEVTHFCTQIVLRECCPIKGLSIECVVCHVTGIHITGSLHSTDT